MKRMFKQGQRVKVKRGVVSSWHGTGTVMHDQLTSNAVIQVLRDDALTQYDTLHAMAWQLSRIKTFDPDITVRVTAVRRKRPQLKIQK